MDYKLYTPVAMPEPRMSLTPSSKVMLIGSCFAQEVGERLGRMMPEGNVVVNPFGVQYNPLSIECVLRLLQRVGRADMNVFKGRDGLWHSWYHTSHFSAGDEQQCRDVINKRFVECKAHLADTDLLVITFGTTRCYRHKDSGIIVSNCHKELASDFEEVEPPLHQLVMQWRSLLSMLFEANPRLRVMFTVSPFRYRKYGFHESQIQKSKLLLLIDTLQHDAAMLCPNLADDKDMMRPEDRVLYFPSYEILLDELRDYRFYATDMLHPSDQAVDIITSHFTEWAFTPELKGVAEEQQKKMRRQMHRRITQ